MADKWLIKRADKKQTDLKSVNMEREALKIILNCPGYWRSCHRCFI